MYRNKLFLIFNCCALRKYPFFLILCKMCWLYSQRAVAFGAILQQNKCEQNQQAYLTNNSQIVMYIISILHRNYDFVYLLKKKILNKNRWKKAVFNKQREKINFFFLSTLIVDCKRDETIWAGVFLCVYFLFLILRTDAPTKIWWWYLQFRLLALTNKETTDRRRKITANERAKWGKIKSDRTRIWEVR